MSLFIREHPLSVRNNHSLLRDPFFDDFEDDFFNRPLIPFHSLYPYYYRNPVYSLEKQLDKTFNSDVFKSVDFSPKINLSEDEKNYYIHADLPGMTKDQVKMEISDEDRVLTISGERETVIDDSDSKENTKEEKKDEKEKANENKEAAPAKEETADKNEQQLNNEPKKENNKKYSRIECSYGKFSRSFSLPENADIENIQAKMENGVLEVTLNKIQPQKKEQKHTIQIQ